MKKNQPKKTKRPYLKWAIAASVTVLISGGVALAYQVTQLPEEAFITKVTVEGFSESEAGLSTSFSTFAELDTATKQWASERLLEPLSLESERGSFPVTLTALGVQVDWNTVDSELKNFMSTAGGFEKIRTYLFGQEFELPLILDEAVSESTLAQMGIEQSNKNAVLMWDGKAVTIQAGQMGYEVQRQELHNFLESSFKNPTPPDGAIGLTLLVSEPDITDAELTTLLPQAQELAGKNMSFQDEFGNTWSLAMKDHMDWVIPNEKDEGISSELGSPWTLDEAAFISYAETILVPEVEEDPTAVVITENADGSISFEGSARFGKELDKLALLDLVLTKVTPQAEVIPAPDAYQDPAEAQAPVEDVAVVIDPDAPIALPINKVTPAITVPDSLKAKGITDLVGLGYSDFGGSPTNRIHNINTGIAQFNGVVIEQGAEFSFMGQMTPVDAEHGFLTELVIKGDETIPEYGGGLCQISSTMFRAALYSGLPITVRRNHSYAVSYYARPYGYGLDATVYDPAPDLKFMNDTAGALLVQAYTEGSSAFYVFYGTNDGRTVSMEGPYSYNYNTVGPQTTYTDKLAEGERELKEYSHTGFTTDWYRTVTYTSTTATTDENGVTSYVSPYAAEASGVRELIHSVYEARPAKYWEGGTGVETPTEE